jgi:transcriptional regulator with XRE-family HTH domain
MCPGFRSPRKAQLRLPKSETGRVVLFSGRPAGFFDQPWYAEEAFLRRPVAFPIFPRFPSFSLLKRANSSAYFQWSYAAKLKEKVEISSQRKRFMHRQETSYKAAMLPNRILKWLDMACLTQRDAARIMGHKNGSQISRWQNGKKLPDLVNIIKLSYALNLSPSCLEELYPALCRRIKARISLRRKKFRDRADAGKAPEQTHETCR